MFEKKIDEIYELCKRVANEVPTASVTFSYSIYGMIVCGLKKKEDVSLPDSEFKWDLYQSVSFNESLRIIKNFLLELLIDGRCPLDVESNGAEAPADNGTDYNGERVSGGTEQAESVHS